MDGQGMAYRGDATDPLANINNGRRAINRTILLIAVLCFLPYLRSLDLTAFKTAFENARPSSSAPVAAPITGAAPGTTKMSAATLEQLLRTAPASKRAPRDVRCTPYQNGWDYLCTYQADAPRAPRLKIGVRVSANAIVQASPPQPLHRPLATP
jgi:hypothetical protein